MQLVAIYSIPFLLAIQSLYCSNTYNCTEAKCDIDCGDELFAKYCTNAEIFCADYAECSIHTDRTPISDVTFHCGHSGICTMACHGCLSVINVTILANDAHNISFISYVSQHNILTSFQDLIVVGNNVEQIYFFYDGHNTYNVPFNNVSIEASSSSSVIIDRCNHCNNFTVNATNSDRIKIIKSGTIHNFFIDGANSTSMMINCEYDYSSTQDAFLCNNMQILCSNNNCSLHGSIEQSIIYANHSKYLYVCSSHYFDNTIYAMNALVFSYNVTYEGRNIIDASYAQNISYSAGYWSGGYGGSSVIYSDHANVLDINCNSCYNLQIYGEFLNTFKLVCNQYTGILYSPCEDMSIYIMKANNVFIKAYYAASLRRIRNGIIDASNVKLFNIECISDDPMRPETSTAVCYGIFNLQNAEIVNWKCLGGSSCGLYGSYYNTTIDVSNVTDAYFYFAGEKAAFGIYAPFVLNGTYASNLTLMFDANHHNGPWASDPVYGVAINLEIYSSIYDTSIYCNGTNSCSHLHIHSVNGIKDVNIIFVPECNTCGIRIDEYPPTQNSYSYWYDFQCFVSGGLTVFCGDNYEKTTMFAPYPDGAWNDFKPKVLCDTICCKGSEYYSSSTACDAPKSFFDEYKSYVIATIIIFVIATFVFIVRVWRCVKRQKVEKDMMLQLIQNPQNKNYGNIH